MERAHIQVEDFVFDEENTSHIARHGVSESDTLEVLRNAPQFFINPPRPDRTATHLMLGPNLSRRFMLVAIIHVEATNWRPITAHWFHERLARRYYEVGDT